MRRLPAPCLECGVLTRNGPRCPAHTAPNPYGQPYRKRRAQLLESNPRCHWCGQPATTADHLHAVIDGGADGPLVPSCAPCNYSRNNNR